MCVLHVPDSFCRIFLDTYNWKCGRNGNVHLREYCFLFCRDTERRKHGKKICRETMEIFKIRA